MEWIHGTCWARNYFTISVSQNIKSHVCLLVTRDWARSAEPSNILQSTLRKNWKTLAKTKQTKVRLSNDAPALSGKEVEWLEYIVKFEAYLATKGCAEVIQTNFKSKLPTTEDEELDASIKLWKAKEIAKMKNAMTMAYMTQWLSGMVMLNVIFNV